MPVKHLAVVPKPQQDIESPPKYLHRLAPDITLSEIFVYSQRDLHSVANVLEQARVGDPAETVPDWTDRTSIDLGGEFSVAKLRLALKAQKPEEAKEISDLRARIVKEIECRGVFWTAVNRPEDGHNYGIVFGDLFTGKFSPNENPLGVMAFDD